MDIEVHNDLSEKTKKENNGIVYVYTRSDLNVMGAKHLRDILKSSVVGYKISRYNLIDPNTLGLSPYASSNVRIYIDNQEISSSLYGSGSMVIGDLSLDFVDHVELYTYNPSFEFSIEPTSAMIKLYTKTYERDPGTNLSLGYGSYDSKSLSLVNTGKLGDYSYMAYLSRDVDNKEKINLGGTHDTSRDTTRTHGLITFYNDKRKFLFTHILNDKDSFLATNWDVNLSKSHIDLEMTHLGYQEKLPFDMLFEMTYDSLEDISRFASDSTLFMHYGYAYNYLWNPVGSLNADGDSKVWSVKLEKKSTIGNHHFLYGIKYRYKDLDYPSLDVDGRPLTYIGIKKQKVVTGFFEDNYHLFDNSILTFAAQYSNLDNNNDNLIEDNNMKLLRIGNTYLHDQWMFQTFYYYQESAIEPYLINSLYLHNPIDGLEKPKTHSLIEKIKYTDEKNVYDLTYTYDKIDHYMRTDSVGLLINSTEDVTRNTLLLRWTHQFENVNKLFFSYYVENVESQENHSDTTNHRFVVQNSNRYDNLSLFEELIVNKTDYGTYYDLSLGANYQYSENLNIHFNVENLLDNALEQQFIHNAVSGSPLEDISQLPQPPFLVSPIDQKIMLTLEYTF
jgi:iron complex outermembrane receptor protein